MSKKLLVATHNQGKVAEFAEMLADLQVEWLSLADIGLGQETAVAETELTFVGNAILKARVYAQQTGLLTLADDSGLEVDALDGAPGIYTSRYGGSKLTHVERYQFLLQNMHDIPWEKRTARFRCVIVLANPVGEILTTAAGSCEGMIALEPAGNGGFGYDPIFYLPGREQTMAQVDTAVKHQISHRGQALYALAPKLKDLFA